MPKATFVLKDLEKNKQAGTACLVYLYFNFDYQRLKYSTSLTVLPAQWNEDEQRALAGKKFPLNTDKNQRLDQIEAAAGKAYYRLQNQGEPITPATLRAALEIELGGQRPTVKPTTLADFAEKLTDELADSRAASTLQVYRATVQHLRDYEKKSRRSYGFDSINLDFYTGFTAYLAKSKGHTPNTVGKYIKSLKAFMNEAAARKLHNNADHRLKQFKVEKAETDAVYLSVAELTMLAELELPASSTLSNVRDIFVLGAFTGLRFSDLAQLSKVSVSGPDGRKVLKVRTQKTATAVVIPLHPLAEVVLARNQGHPPKSYSNPATNRVLKELSQLAGFTSTVEVTTAKGRETKQKWELVTTHTARRSFCTNAYLAGIPLPSIMALSGHSKTQTFMGYIRITAEENAANLSAHSFFQGK